MNLKTKVIICIITVTSAFAAGRWLAPTKVKIEKQIVEVDKKTDTSQTDTDRNKHKETTTKEVVKPDGTKETTTTTVEDTNTNRRSSDSTAETSKKQETDIKEVTRDAAKVTVSALAGVQLSLSSPVVYGASISKPVLGPVTIGVWALTDRTFGASFGLTF